MSSKLLAALQQRKQSVARAQQPQPGSEASNSSSSSTQKGSGKKKDGQAKQKQAVTPQMPAAAAQPSSAAGSKKKKNKKRKQREGDTAPQQQPQQPKPAAQPQPSKKQKPSPSTSAPAASSRPLSALQQKMAAKLAGARFRWLNEKLYTCRSDEAYSYFQQHPEEFDEYHRGFALQVRDWPASPLDAMIQYVRARPGAVVGDFGCGEARLAESVSNKVHSFDLVAHTPRVTACNIRHVPLGDATLDVAVFCLSLMGTDFTEFLREAHRTLKPGGALLVSEVRSRFAESGVDAFVSAVCELGFKLRHKDMSNQMFGNFEFQKEGSAASSKKKGGKQQEVKEKPQPQQASSKKGKQKGKQGPASSSSQSGAAPVLSACIYKKR